MGYNSSLSTHNFTYSLSVYGMYSKQQPGYQCWPHCTEDHSTQLHIQVAHCTVQEHVHQMVPHGLQLMQQVVQPERGHTKRPVRLVAFIGMHWHSPEIIQHQINPRGLWPQVLVFGNGCFVVITQSTIEGVDV